MTTEADPEARWTPPDRPGDTRAPRAWPRFMTAKVAADYADTSRWTVRRNVAPCGRRGRTLVYSIEAVETWMRGNAIAPRRRDVPRNVATPARGASASLARVHSLAEYRQRQRGDHLAGDDGDVAA